MKDIDRLSALLCVVLENVHLDADSKEQIYDTILSNLKHEQLGDLLAMISDLMSRD
tara:strand:- start:1393 stop:1560 length:168 start_codon:yes stop_codon:yes gene_type:complete